MELNDDERGLLLMALEITIAHVHASDPEAPCENDEADLIKLKEKILKGDK